MAEVHVVCKENLSLYENALEEYFRGRYEVYVKERGWKDIDRPDGREIDQFDTAGAIHLIALDKSRVIGGHRFNPTTAPTLLSDVFPHVALRELVNSPDIYETTRIWVTKSHRGDRAHPRVESLLLAGTLEYALEQGISQIRFLMETWWLPRFQEIGWQLRPLGLPTDINGMNCIAVIADVTEEAWAETCAKRSVPGPILVWNGLRSPRLPMPAHLGATG